MRSIPSITVAAIESSTWEDRSMEPPAMDVPTGPPAAAGAGGPPGQGGIGG
jgi:hypothetical protein